MITTMVRTREREIKEAEENTNTMMHLYIESAIGQQSKGERTLCPTQA